MLGQLMNVIFKGLFSYWSIGLFSFFPLVLVQINMVFLTALVYWILSELVNAAALHLNLH